MPSSRFLIALHCLALSVATGATSCSSEVGADGLLTGAETSAAGTAAVSGGVAGRAGAETPVSTSGASASAAVPRSGPAGAGASGAALPASGAPGGGGAVPGPGAGGGAAASAGTAGVGPAAMSGSNTGAAANSGAPAPAPDKPLTVFIAGDSTVSPYADTPSKSDQAGWGQMLPAFVEPGVKIENRAIGGRSARRFIDDGKLDEIWRDIREGDYLLVQFGTNDSNKNASYEHAGQTIPYYLDPATDFKDYLKRYIDGARSRKAIPVLVTPPPRNSAYCTGGNGTGAWAQAMRELGMSSMLIVSDLNQRSVEYLKAICPAPEPPDFFLRKPDGSVDGTHFQERGAQKLAEFVADGLRAAGVTWVK